ncbi:MAG: hypothetical protein R2847_06680 [Bacteroidia bacterium]
MDMIVLESECNMIHYRFRWCAKESYFLETLCDIEMKQNGLELIEQGTAVIGGTETKNIIAAFNRKFKIKKIEFSTPYLETAMLLNLSVNRFILQ